MPAIVDPGRWEMMGSDGSFLSRQLTRSYRLAQMPAPDSHGVLRIDLNVESSNDVTCVWEGLRIFVKPLRLSRSTTFVMGLISADNRGSLVDVLIIPKDGDTEGGATICIHDHDVPKCVRAIGYGQDLTLVLMLKPLDGSSNIRPPFEALMKLELPNDATFSSLYQSCHEEVVRGQEATWARHLRELWYRNRDWEISDGE